MTRHRSTCNASPDSQGYKLITTLTFRRHPHFFVSNTLHTTRHDYGYGERQSHLYHPESIGRVDLVNLVDLVDLVLKGEDFEAVAGPAMVLLREKGWRRYRVPGRVHGVMRWAGIGSVANRS